MARVHLKILFQGLFVILALKTPEGIADLIPSPRLQPSQNSTSNPTTMIASTAPLTQAPTNTPSVPQQALPVLPAPQIPPMPPILPMPPMPPMPSMPQPPPPSNFSVLPQPSSSLVQGPSHPTPTLNGPRQIISKWLNRLRIEENLEKQFFRLKLKKDRNQYTCEGRCDRKERTLPDQNDTLSWSTYRSPRCFCDQECYIHKDCCYDYEQRCPDVNMSADNTDQQNPLSTCKFQVKRVGTRHLGFVLVTSCPMSTTNSQSSKLCSQANQFNKLDILTSVPAFDKTSNKSYGNVFCAACRQRKSLAMWRFEAACSRTLPKETAQSELIKFIASSHCTISSSPPDSVSLSRHRICVPMHPSKQYASINDSSDAQRLQELCKSYAFPVCSITPEGDYRWFKNPHCLLSHGIFDMSDADINCPTRNPPLPPLTILFDFRSTSSYVISRQLKDQDAPEQLLEKRSVCKEDHLFDAFTGKCRRIFERKTNCNFIKLQKSEYTIFRNSSLLFRGMVYTNQSYTIMNESVFMCANLTSNYTVLESRSRSDGTRGTTLDFITGLSIAGCGLSLVSLLLLIISYVVLPDLRNLPGKIVLSIAISMFAYLLLYFFSNRNENPTVCRAIAALFHFFFLSMFFWMNVMAFDIHGTFTRKGNVDFNRRSSGCCGGPYVKYALYACLAPLMIVAVAAGLDISRVYTVYIGYGSPGEHCFINNPDAKLFALVIPVGVILLYNCVALGHTVLHIRRVQKQTSTVANQSRQPGLPVVCIKMTSVMGVSWILGYLAASESTAFFWYPYVILNSLQGFLIFISYVLNRRVLKMYKALFLKIRGGTNSATSKRSTNISPAF